MITYKSSPCGAVLVRKRTSYSHHQDVNVVNVKFFVAHRARVPVDDAIWYFSSWSSDQRCTGVKTITMLGSQPEILPNFVRFRSP